MNREKLTKKHLSCGFLLGALAAAAFLFAACNGIFDKPDTEEAVEDGYGTVRIELVGPGAPPELERAVASATVPEFTSGIDYQYFFQLKNLANNTYNTSTGAANDSGTGRFTLTTGTYRAVAAGSKSGTQVVRGTSTDFSVTSSGVSAVKIPLEPSITTAGTGTLSVVITYPPSATATVNVVNWPDQTAVNLVGTETAGAYVKSLEVPRGSYLLTVAVVDNSSGKVAGAVEVMHIYPGLTTRYIKRYTSGNLSTATQIGSAPITIATPHPGGTPPGGSDIKTPNDSFIVQSVEWTDNTSGTPSAFAAGTDYKVKIVMKANPGFEFSTAVAGSINGALISGTENREVSEDRETLTLTSEYYETRGVSAITVSTPPTLSLNSYKVGDKLDLSGLKLSVALTGVANTSQIVDFFWENTSTDPSVPAYASIFRDNQKRVWNITATPDNGTDFMSVANVPIAFAFGGSSPSVNATATVSANDRPLYVEFSSGTASSKVYDGSDLLSALTGTSNAFVVKVGTSTGTLAESFYSFLFKKKDAEFVPAGSDAGIYTLVATGTNGYSGTGTLDFTITRKSITGTDFAVVLDTSDTASDPKYVVFNNLQQKPDVLSISDTSFSPEFVIPTGTYTVSYGANINAGDTSGTATVMMSTGTGINYMGNRTVNFKIARATPTATNFTVSDFEHEYDGNAKNATVGFGSSSGTLPATYALTGTPVSSPSTVGSYTIKVSTTSGTNSNFEPVTDFALSRNLVINRADIKAIHFAAISSGTYSGVANTATIPSLAPGLTGIGSYVANSIRYNNSATAPVNAGTYNITADFNIGDNFNIGFGVSVGSFTVAKRDPTAEDFTIAKNTANTLMTVTLKPAFTGAGGAINPIYTKQGEPAETTTRPLPAGTYNVTFNVEGGINFLAKTGLSAGTITIPSP